MNYELSEKILTEIKKSEKIIVNCHRSPDPDSIGSALALYNVLVGWGKVVKIVCPSDLLPEAKFLSLTEKVEKIDFAKFDFSKYDLFLSLDSGSMEMVTGGKDVSVSKIPIIVIDHHKTNQMYGEINLVDDKVSSTAELLYSIFEDWGLKADKVVAKALLTGILADTGVFQYQGVPSKTLGIAQKLMEAGADKDEIILNVFHSYPFNKIKFWGEIIRCLEYDEKDKFVWSATPHDVFMKFEQPLGARESAAGTFATAVDGTNFGIFMVEEDPGTLSVSLRSRDNFDVSKIAEKLGGGGHRAAAGVKVYDLNFEKAVEKVLAVAREVVNETNKD